MCTPLLHRGALLLAIAAVFGLYLEAPGASSISSPAPSRADGDTLTRADRVQALSPEEAAKNVPVRIRGTVTFAEFPEGVFVQDASSGVYVRTDSHSVDVRDSVQIRGVTAPGDYSPIIENPSFESLGSGALPDPVTDADRIVRGQADSDWVRFERTVTGMREEEGVRFLLLERSGRRVLAHVRGNGVPVQLGSRVRVEGAAATVFNLNRQAIGVRIMVPGLRFVEVIRSEGGSEAPETATPIEEIATFDPSAESRGNLVRVRGRVSHIHEGPQVFTSEILVQDSTGGIRVWAFAPGDELTPGSFVEVVGRVRTTRYTPVLDPAVVRVLDHRAAPEPTPVEIAELEAGEHSNELVRLDARLLEYVRTDRGHHLIVEAEGRVLRAHLPRTLAESGPLAIRRGAELRLTGVVHPRIEYYDPTEIVDVAPGVFTLGIWDRRDVEVLEAAPWWTNRRLRWVAWGLVGVVTVGAAWTATLRWRVEDRTRALQNRVRQVEDLSERILTVQETERRRIGLDLHDEIGQQLTRLILLLERPEEENASRRMEQARRLAQSITNRVSHLSQTLRPSALEDIGLEAALRDQIRHLEEDTGLEAALTCCEEFRDRSVESPIATAVYRIVQEALTNALRHSGAERAEVDIDLTDGWLSIRVEDEGTGFDLEHVRNEGKTGGLNGMRERARLLDGELDIETEPGTGTRVVARIPVDGSTEATSAS